MNKGTAIYASLGLALASLVSFVVVRLLAIENTTVVLVVGAIVGSQAAAWHLATTDVPALTTRHKVAVGLCLAVSSVLIALTLQLVFHWLPLPEITIPIAAVGTFFFPFAGMSTLFQSVRQARSKRSA